MGQLAIIRPRPLLSALSCPPGGGSLGSGARKEAPPPCLLMSPAIIHVPWPTWPGQDVRHAGAPARPSATHARAGPDAGAFFGWRRRVLRGGGTHTHSLTHWSFHSLTGPLTHSLTPLTHQPSHHTPQYRRRAHGCNPLLQTADVRLRIPGRPGTCIWSSAV